MNELDRKLLLCEARKIGLILRPKQLARFGTFFDELKEWNKRVKLTSLRDDLDILIKHFIDSLLPWHYIPPDARLLDIGSGAGFPGIPLKIALPSLTTTLLDSRLKGVYFQRHMIRMLHLKGIEAIHGRAEQMGRGKIALLYDVVVSRALYTLEDLQRVSSPLLRVRGIIIAFQTPRSAKDAEKRVGWGFQLRESFDCTLPFGKGERKFVLLQKT